MKLQILLIALQDPPENYHPVEDRKRQEVIHAKLVEEIKYYDYNERFDLKGFLEDERMSQLDADLGSQLIDFVFNQLQGIPLMQAQAATENLLVEQ